MEVIIGDETGSTQDSRSLIKEHSLNNEFFIKGFFGDYRYMSNFHISPVDYEGLRYNNVEAAFQSAKVSRPADRERFTRMSPAEAKMEGRKALLPADWQQRKVGVMTECVFSKYMLSNGLRSQLTDTGEKYLEETNWWKDNYWGNDPNITSPGLNKLGKVTMGVRELFKIIEV